MHDAIQTSLSVLDILKWPLVVFIVVFIFKKPIREIISRLSRAKIPGGGEVTFIYGDAKIDTEGSATPHFTDTNKTQTVQTERSRDIDLRKVANVYWLGHDLMWVTDAILRGARRHTVKRGFTQSLHHAREIGFEGSIIEKLSKLADDIDTIKDEDMTKHWRDDSARLCYQLIDEVGTPLGVCRDTLLGFRI